MISLFSVGDSFLNRYEVIELIGVGNYSEVYKIKKKFSDVHFILKLLRKSDNESMKNYVDFYNSFKENLSGFTGIQFPIDSGETDKYYYLIFELYSGFIDLEKMIYKDAPFPPFDSLEILSNILDVLSNLHIKDLIHADLKPANILVKSNSRNKVILIDIGMLEYSKNDDRMIIKSTYKYIHPSLKELLRSSITRDLDRRETRVSIGSYNDIYALGIIAINMLSGENYLSVPYTHRRLENFLKAKNPELTLFNESSVKAIVEFIIRMVTIDSQTKMSSTSSILSTCIELKKIFHPKFKIYHPRNIHHQLSNQNMIIEKKANYANIISDIRDDINEVKISLFEKTAFIASSLKDFESDTNRVILLAHEKSPDQSKDTLVEEAINEAFGNASKRIKTSWKITIGMTLTSFALIAGMVITAILLSIFTGNSGWGVLFGGASVSLIIGTLLWKPFDRIFRATILAQHLEMIHLKSIAEIHQKGDYGNKILASQEAIKELESLLKLLNLD